jgi:murein DD-endopeptidase MepM/ murein hydrolase activator NlpD
LAGDYLTILILPRNSSSVKRYKIPKWILKVMGIALPPLIVLAVVLGLHFIDHPRDASLTAELQATNRLQQEEIRFFSERIAQLQNRIAGMTAFDSKLRVIANLEHMPSSFFGVGGSLSDDLRERVRSQQGMDAMARPMGSIANPSGPRTCEAGKEPQQLGDLVHETISEWAHTPSVWPTKGWVVGDFGCRVSTRTGQVQMQEGVEVCNATGTPIVAPADGLVTTIGTDPDHGRMVVLSHGYRTVTRYGHLEEVEVEIGQRVRRGQRIGRMGSTGLSMGPLLYYEVRVDGIPIDPTHYLYD